MTTTRTKKKVKNYGIRNNTAKDRERRKDKYNKMKKESIRVGTWNVRGLNEDGSIRNLVESMGRYKLDILSVQETKLRATKITTVQGIQLL